MKAWAAGEVEAGKMAEAECLVEAVSWEKSVSGKKPGGSWVPGLPGVAHVCGHCGNLSSFFRSAP